MIDPEIPLIAELEKISAELDTYLNSHIENRETRERMNFLKNRIEVIDRRIDEIRLLKKHGVKY